jgi:D-glycero-alpha-D-manno-heptose-7-phosphate kinase
VIITRSPLTISLAGDQTDLPWFYRQHGGGVIAAAINKYVYITIHETFITELLVKYSQLERVPSFEQIRHPIIREALRELKIYESNIEITSMSDIPAATGFGTSGSFTTALLQALHTFRKKPVQSGELASQACNIQLDRGSEAVGKHDQYSSSFGGVAYLQFSPDDQVSVTPLKLSPETIHTLEDNLILFTTFTHSPPEAAHKRNADMWQSGSEVSKNLHLSKQLGSASKTALESGDLRGFAALLDEHWKHRKELLPDAERAAIDGHYAFARENGALGGKLAGSGESGFILFYTEEKTRLRRAAYSRGLREIRFRFDFMGTTILSQG